MPYKPELPSPPTDDACDGQDVASAPTRPEVHLRRSNRRIAQETHEEDRTRDIQGRVLGIRPENEMLNEGGETPDRREVAKEGVQMAIEGLARMERRLMRDTKRQKLKVENTIYADLPEVQEEDEGQHPSQQTAGLLKEEPIKHSLLRNSRKEALESKEAERAEVGGGIGETESEYKDSGTAEIDEELPDLPERGAARPPAVNSSYLPLPWKGRLGYACLNTYLRAAKPPVFSSRTCRVVSIIDQRHLLQDLWQPEHAVKNRPDKSQAPDKQLGIRFLQELGLANARDIVKMLFWNDKYAIKFMRLSSEMFPFASHEEYGYKLAPFASEVLAEAGKVAAELGHRLTTHLGQFIQLASPRKHVTDAAIRDLEYHDEMLTLLRLPEQQNRDAVMVLHMGGTYGDKAATIDRFRENYQKLSDSIKARLVLENDDVAWSVHDLLPICEELNIPLVLDYHHHNIVFDSKQCREGTLDISQPEIIERIAATWRRKGIKQKMHYSEPCPGAVTPRDRRKHSARVKTLPPCPPDMDLMIEAKDKEQAVFELMRIFKLPGFDKINDMIPYERPDESGPAPKSARKKSVKGNAKRKRPADEEGDNGGNVDTEDVGAAKGIEISEEDFAMGGPENRVYWPPGMEDWLKPMKKGGGNSKAEDDD